MKKKVGEEAARHWIKGMRSIASNIPISPFHLAAADDMESLLEEVLVYRKLFLDDSVVRQLIDAGALQSNPKGLKRINREAEKNGEEL
jgi:hypothetical protein